MYGCLLFILLCVDTVIGFKFGDHGVCEKTITKLMWEGYFLF